MGHLPSCVFVFICYQGKKLDSVKLKSPSNFSSSFLFILLKAPISTVKRFPFHFFSVQILFFFLLLVSCFYTLRPFQIVLFDIELWSRQGRDKEVCRKKGIGDFSLCSFYTVSQLRELRKTHNWTPYAKWEVVIPESSLERNLPQQSSPHT